ncbi:hypothetical protein QQS21_012398 [Conoideocrella luteorostrata]|uniref:3beta-hydroxysteroid 3-dehydrogenase n=1 Tax=Conoideocrella luteorostrata TaxID=1105319 RepID=A0AAJ0CFS5_9HYPO|nr:hypothetical protein QQS21_012398 [Conoideocrella luteorostrata]
MAAARGTIFITGANGGLGSAIVEQIASKPELSAYHGLYTIRGATPAAAPALASVLARGDASHPHDILSLDLTNLDNVRQVAEGINVRVAAGEIPPIRALILNAGFQDFGSQSWTPAGLDVTFAANYLGHWLLTLLLLESMDKQAGKIVLIGSQGHDPNDPRNARGGAFKEERYKELVHDGASFEAIAKGTWSPATEEAGFRGGFRRYGAAKLFLIMMMHELQRRIDQDAAIKNICVLGVDPGTMITGLQRLAPWFIRVVIFQVIYPIIVYMFPNGSTVRTPQKSAFDVLEVTFSTDLGGGKLPKDLYFIGTQPLETSAESRDAHKQQLVWRETVKLTNLKENDTILGNWQ